MKPKRTQPKTEKKEQIRDKFQTPNYATDLLVPFLPKESHIWEPAYGQGKIVNRLNHHGFSAFGTDLDQGINFFDYKPIDKFDVIVTNPPFSLKKEFYERCLSFGVPFALLIPLDFCQWILNAMKNGGGYWIAPTRRIDYITPSGKSGKESNGQFHSGWFCFGLNLPYQITIVDLSLEDKKNV